MPNQTNCTFLVDDEGAGAPVRSFTFDTTMTTFFSVTITIDGTPPYTVELHLNSPNVSIPDRPATRVKALGQLTLAYEFVNPGYTHFKVLFSGQLITSHPVQMDVLIATFVA